MPEHNFKIALVHVFRLENPELALFPALSPTHCHRKYLAGGEADFHVPEQEIP
jgi:hypothetical protein